MGCVYVQSCILYHASTPQGLGDISPNLDPGLSRAQAQHALLLGWGLGTQWLPTDIYSICTHGTLFQRDAYAACVHASQARTQI